MRPALAALLASLLTGCISSYPDANQSFRQAFESGDFAAAAKLAEEQADDPSDPSALVWLLEAGYARRAEGKARIINPRQGGWVSACGQNILIHFLLKQAQLRGIGLFLRPEGDVTDIC